MAHASADVVGARDNDCGASALTHAEAAILFIVLVTACDPDDPAGPGRSGPHYAFPAGGASTIAEADLDLSSLVRGAATVQVVPDIGADGSDDILTRVTREVVDSDPDSYITGVYALEAWPDVVSRAAPFTLGGVYGCCDWEQTEQGWEVSVGLDKIAPTADATGDGAADVWFYDEPTWRLAAGPLQEDVETPTFLAETVPDGTHVQLTSDLDSDGIGEIVGSTDAEVRVCEGPFFGPVGSADCQTAQIDDWKYVRTIDATDVDGDGVRDLLVVVSGALDDRSEWEDGIAVIDGTFTDGTGTVGLTVRAGSHMDFTLLESVVVGDFDGDGHADLAWTLDHYDIESVPQRPETIHVFHDPWSRPDLDERDATLLLERPDVPLHLAGTTDTNGDGVHSLLVLADDVGGVIRVDAATRGTGDPAGFGWVLAADAVPASGAWSADFDDDDLDDVLVVDTSTPGAWLYLGAYLP